MATPIRRGLRPESRLQSLVCNGLQAVEGAHLKHIEEDIRAEFADSLDVDRAFQAEHAQENRWDYLLGHCGTRKIVALEPHTAANKELSTVIRKREASMRHLRGHLKPGVVVAKWFLVASGRVDFIATEMARARLDQSGIQFVGKTLLRKALIA
jgi:hypothetical protein